MKRADCLSQEKWKWFKTVEFEGLIKNTVENESLPVRKHMKKQEKKA